MVKQVLFIWLLVLAVTTSARDVSPKYHGKLDNQQRRVLGFDEVKMLKSESLGGSSLNDASLNLLFRQHIHKSNIKTLSSVRETDLYAHAECPDTVSQRDEASSRLQFIDQQTKLSLEVYRDLMVKDKTMALSYTSHNIRAPQPFCPAIPSVQCTDSVSGSLPLFRTIDGSCNNLQNWWWGTSLTPYKRLLPSNYDDNVEEPRYSSVVPKKKLPNPRQVALDMFRHKETVSIWTSYFVIFGQFVGHDATHTLSALKNDSCAPSCVKECLCHHAHKDRDCYNIPIPNYDYYNTDQKCMPMARSSPSVRDFDCSLGPREQLNFVTHWLDLSQLYGNLNDKAQGLRNLTNGTLKSRLGEDGLEYLPLVPGEPVTCTNRYKPAAHVHAAFECYLTGDPRTEHNTWLSGIQTVFLREHNKVARGLKEINPHWSDETLYQMARRIVTAEYQNIVYAEYLPSTVGPQLSSLYKLPTLKYGYFTGYRSKLYPQVINEFSTAAFRFGHTIIPETSFLADADFKMRHLYGFRPLDYFLFNDELYNTSMSDVLRGALVGPSYDAWPQSNKVLGDWLFNGLFSSGRRWSLPALNIHRGRDHGIPGYNRYRKLCGLREAKKFEEFGDYMSKETINKLKQLYASPSDVDLFVGVVSEFPVKGGIVGPTGGCIIAKQFHDLKYGDRFYFETEDVKIRFNHYQLNNIRYTSSMARILCENTDIKYIQEWPFFVPNIQSNRYMECDRFKPLNLTLWREDPPPTTTTNTNITTTTTTTTTTKSCTGCFCRGTGCRCTSPECNCTGTGINLTGFQYCRCHGGGCRCNGNGCNCVGNNCCCTCADCGCTGRLCST